MTDLPQRSALAASSWVLLPLLFAAVLLSHATLLRLPYFWDEGGYYVPAALDFLKTGTLIPQSTMTNAHPPLPMILMAGWWKVFGFHIVATRVLVCLVAATALLGVFRLARTQIGEKGAWVTVALTAAYPIWFAQSTLAHADIFAAAFTIWGLAAYLGAQDPENEEGRNSRQWQLRSAVMFSLAAMAKETAIITPVALAGLEVLFSVRPGENPGLRGETWGTRILPRYTFENSAPRQHWRWAGALLTPIVPLCGWYAYHRARTGFIFGNPEFLRYNATANLGAHRILLCLWHRAIHLTMHMNMFVPVLCAVAAVFMPILAGRRGLSRRATIAIGVVLAANMIEFSVLGGALLTRYLLPMYPLVLLICVAEWQRHVGQWGWLAAFSAAALLCGIWINPPYAFAPEDNLTYRDMIVLHQRAIAVLEARYPAATVLTAWPASAEISRPELGYAAAPFKFVALENFSLSQMEKAAADPGAYDTALIFSTKWAPAPEELSLSRQNEPTDAKYFDFHLDLRPAEAAAMLHGEVVWQAARGGEWVALLRFPRIVDASLEYCRGSSL